MAKRFSQEQLDNFIFRIKCGESNAKIAREHGISRQRLHQILGNIRQIKPYRVKVSYKRKEVNEFARYNDALLVQKHLKDLGRETTIVQEGRVLQLVDNNGKIYKFFVREYGESLFIRVRKCHYVVAKYGNDWYYFKLRYSNKDVRLFISFYRMNNANLLEVDYENFYSDSIGL